MKNTRAFTLIETVVYIGLFAIIISLGAIAADGLLRAVAHSGVHTTVSDEQRFVLQKIAWALSSASTTSLSGGALTVERYDGLHVSFRLRHHVVEMDEIPLTTANVSVDGLTFTTQDDILSASITIGSSTAILTRFIGY